MSDMGFTDWEHDQEPNRIEEWVCPCPTCNGYVEPEYYEPGHPDDPARDEAHARYENEPFGLYEDETLHLDGCVLPGDHDGPCRMES